MNTESFNDLSIKITYDLYQYRVTICTHVVMPVFEVQFLTSSAKLLKFRGKTCAMFIAHQCHICSHHNGFLPLSCYKINKQRTSIIKFLLI